ncbi:MAG TPA: dihydropteroate synthase [Gemmatimonadales bacterium]|nr:dihydropteroate synthase [Gemmatimonadales bacterium]
MNVTPLALHTPRAVREALRSHGWEETLAGTAAEGIHSSAFHLTGLDQGALEALVPFAGSLGLEVLTGDGWAILAGSRSRLSALARPWMVPESLRQVALGVGMALPPEPARIWQTARGSVFLDRPILVGILNVTPDSFSDGGRYAGLDAALAHAEELLGSGAYLLDVGGESTRPGRTEDVPADEELRRVIPVIEALARNYPELIISIDTVKASVAHAALEAGAAVVNDVSALRLDPAMASTVASAGAGVILMHSRGSVLELASYRFAQYANGDVVGEVLSELRQSLVVAAEGGIGPDATVVDPGFGFAKTAEQNLLLFDQLAALQALGRPVLVGPSRKRFLGTVTGEPVEDRDPATALACALAYERGARLFRIHDVARARDTLALAHALGTGT